LFHRSGDREHLVCNGFQVEIVKEHGKKGEDFDLLAAKGGITVSVEVTSKLDGPLTAQTLKNTLHAKRSQVPPNRPAVLYLHIPADWMQSESDAFPIFNEVFVEFMKRSRRFNVIVLVWEKVIPLLGGGIPTMSSRACFNNRPRHPFENPQQFEIQLSQPGHGLALSFLEKLKTRFRNRTHEPPS
jgi:hypothetical protein